MASPSHSTAAGSNPVKRRAPDDSRSTRDVKSRRRFVAIGVALILAIAVSDFLIVSMEREASYAAHEQATMQLTRGLSAQTGQRLEAIDKVLRETPGALNLGENATPDRVEATLRAASTAKFLSDRQAWLPGVLTLSVIDAEGRLENGSPAGSAAEIDASQREAFRRLAGVAGSEPLFGAPERDAVTGASSVSIARRMTTPRGDFAGVISARLSLDDLHDFYRLAMPPRRSIVVMRDDGMVLLEYMRDVDKTGQKAPGLAALSLEPSGGASYHGPDIVDGMPVVAAVARMKVLPLVIETSGPEADSLVGWKLERLWLALGGIVASAFIVGLLRLFAGQMRRLEDSELSLATAHRHLDLALSNIPLGVCFFDERQRLIVSNRHYWELYGLPPGSIAPGATLAEIASLRYAAVAIKNHSRDEYVQRLEAVGRAGEAKHAVVELADGRTIATYSQPMPGGGWVATHEDISERRKAEDKIAFLAEHDALTGLPNRSLLMERIAKALADAARGARFAIQFLDLDRFKAVNDTRGHKVGDELLRKVATRLTGTVRQGCTVARLGGDEFVILQVGVKTPEDAATLARRIIATIAAPYRIEEHEVVIGVSVGVDLSGPESNSADLLLKNADLALYLAKAEGRGAFRFFEPDMDSNMRKRHDLEADLRRALAERQFELHYQPILDAGSGEVTQFEALLRWRHPLRGLSPPGEFIALAEDVGLIVPIGEWVIQQACRDASDWPETIRVAVNLSPVQFRAAGLVSVIEEALSAAGLAPARLELEITESVLLQNNERVLATLHRLRELGVAIAMDDFGVGYSSMSYLRMFPFDRIKIDRSFVGDLAKREQDRFFVRSIVDLCRNLGIRTTAEGVETFDQLAVLLDEGCTELQGYLFARPGPAETVEELLRCGNMMPARSGRRAPVAPSAPLTVAAE